MALNPAIGDCTNCDQANGMQSGKEQV